MNAKRFFLTAREIAFRYLAAFLVLSIAPFPVAEIPWIAPHLGTMWLAWQRFLVLVARNVLHITGPLSLAATGSGDRTIDYVGLFVKASLAALVTLVWSAARARNDLPRAMLRVYLRYYLASVMLFYGLAKVYTTQFPSPQAETLMHSYGEASPMNLLWTFMGYSRPYTMFTGVAEVVGGALLFFRRTTTLGALLLTAVLANVVMLNFCYDVPVKLQSLTLLAIAIYLASRDALRLARVFVLNRPVAAVEDAGMRSPRLRRAAHGLKAVVIAGSFGVSLQGAAAAKRAVREWESAPLVGAYKVEAVSDEERWRRVAIGPSALTITREDDTRVAFPANVNAETKTIDLEGAAVILTYEQPDAEHLVLHGAIPTGVGDGNADLVVRLRKIDIQELPLVSRGFHWISERPYNR